MSRLRETRGQAAALTVVFLVAVLGFGALAIDVGSWFHARRTAQAAADAAALGGAQALPADPGDAAAAALQLARQNGATTADIAVATGLSQDDTISVHVHRPAPAYFSSVFGLSTVTTGATATARVADISSATRVAPIVVSSANPMLSGQGCPCFGTPATLPLDSTGAPGAFDLVDFDSSNGTTGVSTLSSWIESGYPGYLPLGSYASDAGAKWNSSSIQCALGRRIGSDLLFPVYDTLTGSGANARYHTIAWVGFHLTGVDARGSGGSLSGYFTQVIWQGIQVTAAGQTPDLGARSIQLLD